MSKKHKPAPLERIANLYTAAEASHDPAILARVRRLATDDATPQTVRKLERELLAVLRSSGKRTDAKALRAALRRHTKPAPRTAPLAEALERAGLRRATPDERRIVPEELYVPPGVLIREARELAAKGFRFVKAEPARPLVSSPRTTKEHPDEPVRIVDLAELSEGAAVAVLRGAGIATYAGVDGARTIDLTDEPRAVELLRAELERRKLEAERIREKARAADRERAEARRSRWTTLEELAALAGMSEAELCKQLAWYGEEPRLLDRRLGVRAIPRSRAEALLKAWAEGGSAA